MSLLDVLHNALGGGEIKRKPQTRATANTAPGAPVQRAKQQILGNNTQAAADYARNPRSFRGDPAQFGYPEDLSGMSLRARLGTDQMMGLGDAQMPVQNPNQEIQGNYGALPLERQVQGGVYNPGNIPLQGSRGVPPIQARYSNWFDY